MKRERYNREKEHTQIGMFPGVLAVDMGRGGTPPAPRFYRPVSNRENFRLLFEGKTPYWLVNSGWIGCDMVQFRPRQNIDNVANHQCFDGGGDIDFEAQGNEVVGWFDIPLTWVPSASGATVTPNSEKFEDMNDWKEFVKFPDLDAVDWDEMKKMNGEFLAQDKVIQLGIQYSFWERLLNLIGAESASIALMDEDQEEAMHEFLDALADFYIDYIDRCTKVGQIDSVLLHDDWGTQKAPFFSLATARKFFVPPLKKVVDFVHSKGMIYEHHSCGNCESLVPAFIDAGVDFWTPQPALNDLDGLIEKYKDAPITFAVSSPYIKRGSSEEEVRELGRAWVEKYKDKGILMTMNVAVMNDPGYDFPMYPVFADAVYEYSRIAYQDCDI